MKSYQKHIRFENIKLQLHEAHPKDISRVHFQLIQNHNLIHKTKKYATVTSHSIQWNSPLQFMYLAQQSFHFQTISEHQYGYEIEDLKVLYSGKITIKPQDFFIANHFPLFNKQGSNCGNVTFIIKIVDREVGVKYNQEDQVLNQQRIKLDLVAKITFLQATLLLNPLYIKDYEGKKSLSTKSHLILQFDTIKIIGNQKQSKKWVFKGQNKFQLLQKSQPKIKVKLFDSSDIILFGQLTIDSLLKNKRFLTHKVPVSNEKGLKIGTMILQLRVIEKKQILDLMYSPKKLENVKMQKTDFETEFSRIKQNLQSKIISSQPVLNMKKRHSLDSKRKDSTFFAKLSQSEFSESNSTSKVAKNQKYNIYLKNRYQDVKFPQSKRFVDIKPKNPYISYTDQQFGSDFSPKNKSKGANFSKTERIDFTTPFKNHPGIGDYHLPSIWQRS